MIDFDPKIEALLAKRQLMLIGEVNGHSQEMITAGIIYLNALGNEPIQLFIDSCGGMANLGLLICDAIQNSYAPIHGIVTGFAASMAFFILQACHQRLAYRHAKLTIHGMDLSGVRIDDPHLQQKMEEIQRLFDDAVNMTSERSGQPTKKIKELAVAETHFTAQEAKELNLLDEIIQIQL